METVALLVSVAAVLVALFGTFVNMWLYRTQTDPEVIVFAASDEVEQTLIWIVVQNIGKGLATNIKFVWRNGHPVTAGGNTAEEVAALSTKPFEGPLINGIPSLGPGSRRVFVWGQYAGIAASLESRGGELRLLCEFSGGRPYVRNIERKHRREYVLEVASFSETITRDSPERKMSRSLKRIEDQLVPLLRKLRNQM